MQWKGQGYVGSPEETQRIISTQRLGGKRMPGQTGGENQEVVSWWTAASDSRLRPKRMSPNGEERWALEEDPWEWAALGKEHTGQAGNVCCPELVPCSCFC